ncbi:hypothetical protein PO883_32740, partial [Massilia sp. DJPM01]|nr:hypothetical protein [Massilia sp. DJPM01]
MQRESHQHPWSARLQEQASSGLGIQAWCVREGLTASAFHDWRKRLAMRSQPTTKLIALPSVSARAEPALEVRTPSGYVIRIASQELMTSPTCCRLTAPPASLLGLAQSGR